MVNWNEQKGECYIHPISRRLRAEGLLSYWRSGSVDHRLRWSTLKITGKVRCGTAEQDASDQLAMDQLTGG